MKTTFLIIALVGCVALGILGVEQSKKLKSQSDELAATKQQVLGLEAELRQKEDAIENAKSVEAKSQILQKTLSESTTVAAAQSKKPNNCRNRSTKPRPTIPCAPWSACSRIRRCAT